MEGAIEDIAIGSVLICFDITDSLAVIMCQNFAFSGKVIKEKLLLMVAATVDK